MSEKEVRRETISYTAADLGGRTISLIERLGIESVKDVNKEGSSFPQADYINAISDTKKYLQEKAHNYALDNKKFGEGIDALLEDDDLSKMARKREWEGMVEPGEYASVEQVNTYHAFREGWKEIKRDCFVGLVQNYWERIKKTHQTEVQTVQPELLRLGMKQYAKIAAVVGTVASVLTGLVVGALYLFLIKPDIERTKEETTQSVFYMVDSRVNGVYDKFKSRMMEDFANVEIPEGVLLDAFEKLRPEIRKETQQNQFDFDMWYAKFVTQAKKDFPILSMMSNNQEKEEKKD